MDVDHLAEPPSVWRPASLLRMAGLLVGGIATGALGAAFTLYATFDSGLGGWCFSRGGDSP
jgi:hypothetical protein